MSTINKSATCDVNNFNEVKISSVCQTINLKELKYKRHYNVITRKAIQVVDS